MPKAVTLKQVAEVAGVSTATVSYVINRQTKQHILPETQRRVYEAIRQVGYTPIARRKKFKKIGSRYIGIVLGREIDELDVAQMMSGFKDRLAELGYYAVLFVDQTREIGKKDYISAYLDGTIAGIVFIAGEDGGPDASSRKILIDREIPFVVEDEPRLTRELGETRAEDIIWLVDESDPD